MFLQYAFVATFVATAVFLSPVESCNEAVCASMVSKCMLTQSCKCDIKNASCVKNCSICLSDLFIECCSCVDICPKPNDTVGSLSESSHVGDFMEPVPSLFQALMSEPNVADGWTSHTFAIDYNIYHYWPKPEKEVKYYTQTGAQEIENNKNIVTINCTVAYMDDCLPWNKCMAACKTTGASSYRWFHDGCCECIGDHCINYGLNENRCSNCPGLEDDGLSEDDESSFIYDYETEDQTKEEEEDEIQNI